MIDFKNANIDFRIFPDHPKRPLVIAYYTKDTPYVGEAEVLKLSLASMGYSYKVCGVSNRGTWQKNTQMKAEFIQQMLAVHPGRPMLYLDVDAIMVKRPVFLNDLCADIAAVHFCKQNELLSGTVFFGNTPKCREVVDCWIRINADHPKFLPGHKLAWDQRTLQLAINRIEGVNFVELPQGYTWIAELTERCSKEEVVAYIVHTRGAKRFKNIIDGKKGFAV